MRLRGQPFHFCFLFFGIGLMTLNLSAKSSPLLVHSQSALCEAYESKGFLQKRLQFETGNRLSFRNLPGPAGRGLCWWHSRFTRSALYLAVFRPDIDRKPNAQEAEEIINHLVDRDQVVEITGYSSLWDFSQDFPKEIEEALSWWSLRDTFNLNLANAFIGQTWERPEKLSRMMDDLYHLIHDEGRVVFQTLQLPGLSAHSWLVVDMEPTPKGYQLKTVDSNYFEVQIWNYERGQSQFDYSFTDFLPVVGRFVPYVNQDWHDEETEIRERVEEFCKAL